MRKHIQKISIILALLFPSLAFSQGEIVEVFKKFKMKAYEDALVILSSMDKTGKSAATRFYFEGLCYSRMQEYNKAVTGFKKAIELNSPSEDLYYEYGQALLAINDLEASRDQFSKSYKQDFKPSISLYYMGHISGILDQHNLAEKYYKMALSRALTDKNLQQILNMQLAETYLSAAEDKDNVKEIVKKQVLPQFKKAHFVDPKSKMAPDIQKRHEEVERRYGLDPNYMVNGRRISKKKYGLSISQKVKYDSNVTYSTNEISSRETQRDSYIFDTKLFAKYRFVLKQMFIVTPQINLKNKYHSDRDSSTVYKNDSYSISPAIKTKYEHTLLNEKASFLTDIDYDYTEKDRYSRFDKVFNSRDYSLAVGEKFKYFIFGDTTFKLKYKFYYNYDYNSDSKTTTLSINQMVSLPKKHSLTVFLKSDFARVKNDLDSTDTYYGKVTYTIRKIAGKYNLKMGYAQTFADTKLQKTIKGIEKTYNPTIKISRKVTKKLKFSIDLGFTKKTSKNKEDNAYEKHNMGFEIKYSF